MKIKGLTIAGKEKQPVFEIILGRDEMRLIHDLCVKLYRDPTIKAVFELHPARNRARNIFTNIGKALKDYKEAK